MSEAPQSAASDRVVAAFPQAVGSSPRRIALEDPSDGKTDETDSSSSYSSRRASLERRRSKSLVTPPAAFVAPVVANDDAELREAIRLSLMEAAEAPAAVRP